MQHMWGLWVQSSASHGPWEYGWVWLCPTILSFQPCFSILICDFNIKGEANLLLQSHSFLYLGSPFSEHWLIWHPSVHISSVSFYLLRASTSSLHSRLCLLLSDVAAGCLFCEVQLVFRSCTPAGTWRLHESVSAPGRWLYGEVKQFCREFWACACFLSLTWSRLKISESCSPSVKLSCVCSSPLPILPWNEKYVWVYKLVFQEWPLLTRQKVMHTVW